EIPVRSTTVIYTNERDIIPQRQWVARTEDSMSGANASPTGRSHQEMSGANASPTRSASAIARSLKVGRSHQEKETPLMDPIRRKILKTGAAVTAMAAAPGVFAEQTGKGGTTMSFYEKGRVRIHYE